MTATVGTLLDDAHTRTWDLCTRLADHAAGDAGADRVVGLLAALVSAVKVAVLAPGAAGAKRTRTVQESVGAISPRQVSEEIT